MNNQFLIYKSKPLITVFPPLSVFLSVYPSAKQLSRFGFFVQPIHEVASQIHEVVLPIFRKLVLRAFTRLFLTVYPSQYVPNTVSQQGLSFLRTVNLVFLSHLVS